MIDKALRDLVMDRLPTSAVLDAVSVEPSRKPPGFRIEAKYSRPGDDLSHYAELPLYEVLGTLIASLLGVRDASPSGHQDTEDWFPADGY